MNRKQFVLVLLALCIIGGAGLTLFKRNQKTWDVREAKVGEFVFPDFKPNDVASIHVKDRQDFWIVRSNGTWIVPTRYNYRANFQQISSLIIEIKQMKVMQSEIVGPSLRERVDLADPGTGQGAAFLIEFADANGKVMHSLLLGRRHDKKQNENEPLGMRGWFDGRYILIPSEPNNVLLVPSLLPGAAPDPGGWLDHSFFKVENVKFISLASPDPKKNWELTRETPNSKWTLNGTNPDQELDRTKMAQATEIWAFPTFLDLLSNVPPAEVGLDKPNIVTVVTFDNLAYTIKVGAERPDGSHYITVAVAADLSSPRIPGSDETPEDKKRLDDEFEAKKNNLRATVEKDHAFAPWIFVADDWINVVLRDRAELVAAPSPTKEASLK
ncbi:MAG: uncharacterized protein JWO95_234 [Verrucomicrobiales bacterium]|nr:uncharacterized protein [Verrucomicrobiales bacterium]